MEVIRAHNLSIAEVNEEIKIQSFDVDVDLIQILDIKNRRYQ